VSENLKPQIDDTSPTPGASDPLSLDTSLMQAAEARMRRALGLEGGARQRSPERTVEAAPRVPTIGHKRRFVQDGEVPVTVVSPRREETPLHRGPNPAGPSRLEAAEAALTAEIANRQQAEKALAEAQAMVHDLQTKIGHAELARIEAVDNWHREQAQIAELREQLRDCEARLRDSETARAAAEHGRRARPAPADADEDESAEPPMRAVRRGRPAARKPVDDSKLVRWWIRSDAGTED
jgi:hypothetical protein